MEQVPITTIGDTIVSEWKASTNYTARPQLLVRNVTNRRVFSYLDFRGLIYDESAIVTKAILRLTPTASWPSTTFRIRRQLQRWTPSGLRWTNIPEMGPVSVTHTGAGVQRQPYDIDITNILDAWLTERLPNFGIRIETTSTAAAGRSFHSVNASGTAAPYRPVLLLEVTYQPDPPTALNPGDGAQVATSDPLGTWRYGGAGVTGMVAYQVQTSLSGSGWETPTSDTGEVAAIEPQHQFTGLTGEVAWRARHKSADGRWSEWSEPVWFGVTAKPTVTITSTDEVVTDPSPTTTWTVSGGTQTAYRVILRRADSLAVLADSGELPGDAGQWAPDAPLSVPSGVGVLREVRVWDDVERTATPGEPVYAVATSGPFTVEPATSVDPVADLSVSTSTSPVVDLSWSLSSTPDAYIVERSINGGTWQRFEVESGDVAQGGGGYLWRDVTAPPEHDLSYRVRVLLNGAMSEMSNEVSTRYTSQFVWLADPSDPSWILPLAGSDEVAMEPGEDSAVINVLGSDRSIISHEGRRAPNGTVTGRFLSGVPAMVITTAQGQRDASYRLIAQPTKVWRMIWADHNIPVVVRNVQPVPQPGAELSYAFSCEWYQQGELPWTEDD